MLAVDVELVPGQRLATGAVLHRLQPHFPGLFPMPAEREEREGEISSRLTYGFRHGDGVCTFYRFHLFSSKGNVPVAAAKGQTVIFPAIFPLHYNPKNQRRRAHLARFFEKTARNFTKPLKNHDL